MHFRSFDWLSGHWISAITEKLHAVISPVVTLDDGHLKHWLSDSSDFMITDEYVFFFQIFSN